MVNCAFCKTLLSSANARRSSMAKEQNIVLLMSLASAGYIEVGYARRLVEPATLRRVYLCDEHVVQAAKYISVEMAVEGKGIAHYDDPWLPGPKVCVTNGDIPQHVVNAFNAMARGIASITARDVSRFMNDALKRYYSTTIWRETKQICGTHGAVQKSAAGNKSWRADEKEWLEEAAPNGTVGKSLACSEPIVNEQMDTRDGDEMAQYDGAASLESAQVSEREARASDRTYKRSSEDLDYTSVLGDVEETDEPVPKKFFMVQGAMLMSLFRFCPECGHRLGKAQLKAIGTAAVVQFVCRMCFAKKWESQKRILAHPNEKKEML